MDEKPKDTEFAVDLTDGRKPGDWKSRWKEGALWRIWVEAGVMSVYFFLGVGFIVMVPQKDTMEYFGDGDSFGRTQFVYALAGGLVGGTIHATKWLYHVVAKWTWNADRLLWRIYTPLISAALAAGTITLMNSGLLLIIDRVALVSPWVNVSIAFLVGYFSDTATGKLAEIARILFGTTYQETKK